MPESESSSGSPSGSAAGLAGVWARENTREINRLHDEREAVVINKLALEYRQMQRGGAVAKVPGGYLAKKEDPLEKGVKQAKDRTRDRTDKRDQKERMQVGIKANKLMFHFRL